MEFIALRFGKLAEALGDRPWLAGDFSVADIAMATVLRAALESGAVAAHPPLAPYLARCLPRPAFHRAPTAPLAPFPAAAGPAGCVTSTPSRKGSGGEIREE